MLNILLYSVIPRALTAIFPFIQIHVIGISGVGDKMAIVTSFSYISIGVLTTVCNDIFLRDLIKVKAESGEGAFIGFSRTLFGLVGLAAFVAAIITMVLIQNLVFNHKSGWIDERLQDQVVVAYSLNVFLASVASFGRIYLISCMGVRLANIALLFQGVLAIIIMFLLHNSLGIISPIIGLVVANTVFSAATVLLILKGNGVKSNVSLGAVFDSFKARHVRTIIIAHFVSLAVAPCMESIATALGAGLGAVYSWCSKAIQIPQGLILGPILETVSVGMMRSHFSGRGNLNDIAKCIMEAILSLVFPVSSFAYLLLLCGLSIFELSGILPDQLLKNARILLPVMFLIIPISAVIGFNSRLVFVNQNVMLMAAVGSITQISVVLLSFGMVKMIGISGLPISKIVLELGFLVPMTFIVLARQGVYSGVRLWLIKYYMEIGKLLVIFVFTFGISKFLGLATSSVELAMVKGVFMCAAIYLHMKYLINKVEAVISNEKIRGLLSI